ncbi:MAG: ribosomal L7Ae/L30e/S12e/Gadd45 family protein [Lachnospiraceae bacterium]|nr:ribosomal L7Ae/L30e/S12e/Gadd45 family protein [Lachnospiraceae bacterium]
MQQDKILSNISLATKAGKTVSGEFSVEKAVKEGKACLVVVSAEASDNTKKMFRNMCTFYKVPLYFYGTKVALGHFMGKEFRASLAITDMGLASSVEKQLVLAGIERQDNTN